MVFKEVSRLVSAIKGLNINEFIRLPPVSACAFWYGCGGCDNRSMPGAAVARWTHLDVFCHHALIRQIEALNPSSSPANSHTVAVEGLGQNLPSY